MAQSTQDTQCDTCANSNIFPLMLLACSVDTPIHINRSHLLVLHCTSLPASCVVWAYIYRVRRPILWSLHSTPTRILDPHLTTVTTTTTTLRQVDTRFTAMTLQREDSYTASVSAVSGQKTSAKRLASCVAKHQTLKAVNKHAFPHKLKLAWWITESRWNRCSSNCYKIQSKYDFLPWSGRLMQPIKIGARANEREPRFLWFWSPCIALGVPGKGEKIAQEMSLVLE